MDSSNNERHTDDMTSNDNDRSNNNTMEIDDRREQPTPAPRLAPAIHTTLPSLMEDHQQPTCNEKAIYQRSSELIDEQSRSQVAWHASPAQSSVEPSSSVVASLPPQPSISEKALYQRSFDLIDTYAASQDSQNRRGHVSLLPNASRNDTDIEEEQTHPNLANPVADVMSTPSSEVVANTSGSLESSRARHHSHSKGPAMNTNGSSAQTPGAQYVRSRPIGILPSQFIEMYRRQLSTHAETGTILQTTTPVISTRQSDPLPPPEECPPTADIKLKSLPRTRLYHLLIALAGCILVAGVVGVTFAVIKGKTTTAVGNDTGATRFSPFTTDCQSLITQAHPHPYSQCYCNKKITTAASDIVSRYGNLTASFIRDVYSSFNESFESCASSNQALVWLASGDGYTDSTPIDTMRQRYRLAVLFSLWNGLGWAGTTGWLSSGDECSWFGLACNNLGTVVSVSLSNNSVVGELTPAMPLLTNLVSLVLDGNYFHGSNIPREINAMINLQHLELVSTGINGTIPRELFELNATLQYFNAADNSLMGTIPTLIAALGNLQHWNVGDNKLVGSLPATIGACTNLLSLEIENNRLIGSIPSQIGLLSSLDVLNANGNNLTGTIPTEIGLCANLTSFDIGNNHINGTMPTELGSLTFLQYLNLQDNQLNGTIPSSVGKCLDLVEFEIASNYLVGSVPSELGSLSKIELFDLQGNGFSNGAPSTICQGYNDLSKPVFHCYACKCPYTIWRTLSFT